MIHLECINDRLLKEEFLLAEYQGAENNTTFGIPIWFEKKLF